MARPSALALFTLSLSACSVSTTEDDVESQEGTGGTTSGEKSGDSKPVGEVSPPEALISFEGYNFPSWSFDGSVLIAHHIESNEMHRLDVVTGETSPFLSDEWHGAWSPTANVHARIDGSGEGAELVLLSVETREETRVSGFVAYCGFAWSPDGTQILTTREAELPPPSEDDDPSVQPHSELVLHSLTGEELWNSAALPGYAKCNPTWSSDGRYIYFTSRTEAYGEWIPNQRQAYDLETEELAVMEQTAEAWFSPWITGPEGQNVGLRTGREDSHVSVCYGSGAATPTCLQALEEGTDVGVSIHPLTGLLAITGHVFDNQLRFFRPTDEAEVYAWFEPSSGGDDYLAGTGYRHPAWSPIDERLAVVRVEGGVEFVELIDTQQFLDRLD